ncbi:hypothetical protein KSS87_006188 [Heliosperma pusillum]|nr:hypothetical protein KSS87_006188 [Heliosperma pusillum]
MNNCKWEIIYVPPKPPFSPIQQPTVDVFASDIDPKIANILVRMLNQIAPMENFRHVKRVRRSCSDGKTKLSVILCVVGENETEMGSMPKDVLELTNSNQLNPFVTQVCKYAATTKEEWEEQCKLWPTSFHPPTYNIEGITGFGEEDSKLVFNYMSFALKLARSGSSQLANSAVIVDPSANQVIASARDGISSWLTCPDDYKVQSVDVEEPPSRHGVTNGSSSLKLNTDGLPADSTSCSGVSCLNPWHWPQQHPQSSVSCFWHPLRHAAMVAIENSASRDRLLFPSTENIDERFGRYESVENSVVGSPAKRQRRSPSNGERSEADPAEGFKSERPYLCTGYDVYLAWEPCAMCAMSLLHQRIRRIFYAFPNPSTGALGSVYRLQGEKSLNHHYAVFRVVLRDEPPLGRVEDSATISGTNDL